LKYRVLIKKSPEGYAVWVPGLPGCASQGASEPEALANIRIAIAEYLSVVNKISRRRNMRSRVVQVSAAV
jgi:predicted RNase H-like HicB family nuclease